MNQPWGTSPPSQNLPDGASAHREDPACVSGCARFPERVAWEFDRVQAHNRVALSRLTPEERVVFALYLRTRERQDVRGEALACLREAIAARVRGDSGLMLTALMRAQALLKTGSMDETVLLDEVAAAEFERTEPGVGIRWLGLRCVTVRVRGPRRRESHAGRRRRRRATGSRSSGQDPGDSDSECESPAACDRCGPEVCWSARLGAFLCRSCYLAEVAR